MPKTTKTTKTTQPPTQPPMPPMPLLSGPAKKTASGKTVMGQVSGYETEVDQLIAAKEQIESLESEVEILRAKLEPVAAEARLAKEIETGKCIKSVLVDGSERPIRFTQTDRFKPIGVEHEPVLRGYLGADFGAILQRTTTVTVRKGTTEADLKKALGDKYDALREFIDVTEAITVLSEGMERRAAIRAVLTPTQNQAVDEILRQTQYKPTMNTKG